MVLSAAVFTDSEVGWLTPTPPVSKDVTGFAVDRATDHLGTGFLRHGPGLAGDHRLADVGPPCDAGDPASHESLALPSNIPPRQFLDQHRLLLARGTGYC